MNAWVRNRGRAAIATRWSSRGCAVWPILGGAAASCRGVVLTLRDDELGRSAERRDAATRAASRQRIGARSKSVLRMGASADGRCALNTDSKTALDTFFVVPLAPMS